MANRFLEVADRVWVARYASYDLNITLIGGDHGAVLVDTRATAAEARELLGDVAEVLGDTSLRAVINTHYHHDHTVGNATIAAAHPDAELICHEECARELAEHAAAGSVLIPGSTVSSARVLDLGDRSVELVHPGPAHTGGDLVISVPDAGVVVLGDLVEESAPPSLGADSYPLAWPAALDLALQLIAPEAVVVPGHGRLVDRAFVQDQRVDLGIVAQTISDLAASGVGKDEALATGTWPYPAPHLADAVRRGYDQLPRGGRRLPLA